METNLVKLMEHNHWANQQILATCLLLSPEQLDTQPQNSAYGTIRQTLVHLTSSQRGYLALLTLPLSARPHGPVPYEEVAESLRASGEGLIRLAQELASAPLQPRLQTRDGFSVEPWVVILQVINHATEHREQIKSMLTSLGITPPSVDGWDYGEASGALAPMSAA
jgi:uncharacterized damage-inducible protein DinB